MTKAPGRLASIDAFRALTMFLMIFVNDTWTVKHIPEWIEHASGKADAMGFADTILPCFMFLVGLSLPIALSNRQAKGDTFRQQLYHILIRSFALIVMGFMLMNLENYNNKAALLPVSIWALGILLSFFLIWLDYPKDIAKTKKWIFQGLGVLIMAGLCAVYKGGENGNVHWMAPDWWGILGMIGWSYLLCALIYLFSQGKVIIPILGFVFFLLFNILATAHVLSFLRPVREYIWIIGNGGEPTMMMAGVLISLMYTKMNEKQTFEKYGFVSFSVIAVALIALGFALRPINGISKIRDTPSWVCICTGIAVAVFGIIVYLVDRKGKQGWFKWIWPAGTATLTCYLIPDIYYALLYPDPRSPWYFIHDTVRQFRPGGILGIVKCLVFAFIMVLIGGFLERKKLKLKL